MDYQTVATMFLETPAQQWEHVGTDYGYAVFCKEDVNLRIVSTLDEQDVQQEDFREPWTNNFADPRATGYYYNLYYGATLLHRFILVSVDGARASLPIPNPGTLEVTRAQWKVAEIFDTLGTLDRYAHQAGLTKGTELGL